MPLSPATKARQITDTGKSEEQGLLGGQGKQLLFDLEFTDDWEEKFHAKSKEVQLQNKKNAIATDKFGLVLEIKWTGDKPSLVPKPEPTSFPVKFEAEEEHNNRGMICCCCIFWLLVVVALACFVLWLLFVHSTVCTCDHGTVTDDPLCKPVCQLGLAQTASKPYCAQGHHPSPSGHCMLNVCTCAKGGHPAKGADCLKHGEARCATCDSGYHITKNGICKMNVCSCKSGAGALGDKCEKDGEHVCTVCDSGYHLTNAATCEINKCTCDEGYGAEGAACPEHGSALCSGCNSATHVTPLVGGACVAKKKWSKGACKQSDTLTLLRTWQKVGDPQTCTEMCRCLPHCAGFFLRRKDNECVPVKAGCDKNDLDPSYDYYDMSECSPKLGHCIAETCKLKVCTCKNGVPALGYDCPTHGAAKCTRCHAGHHLSHDGGCTSVEESESRGFPSKHTLRTRTYTQKQTSS